MERTSVRIAALIAALALVLGTALALLSGPLGAFASGLSPAEGSHTGSFDRDTITVKVSGSPEGAEVGPFLRLHFAPGDRPRTLTVHLDQVISEGGKPLTSVPIYLYRSTGGPVHPGDEILAFSGLPDPGAEQVASDQSRGVLVWNIQPGDYIVFFGWTRPIVRVAPEDRPAEVVYKVVIE